MQPILDEFTAYSSNLAQELWPGHPPYTFAQLEQFWEGAGGSAAAAPVAAAIGMAEQGANQLGDWVAGQPTSLGPWQINSSNWPALEAAGIIKSPSDLMNPSINALAAIFISGNGAHFHPWTTYWSNDGGVTNAGDGNGAFRAFLGGAGGSTVASSSSSGSTGQQSASKPVNFSPAVVAGIAVAAVLAALLAVAA